MAFEKYTIYQFEKAIFYQDFSEISEEESRIVYSEYLDTSGLYQNEDFELRGYINHLHQRITFVKFFLKLQREFIEEFGVPFKRDFEFFKFKYGYNLKWNNSIEDFEKQIEKIEKAELKYESSLEAKIKELKDKITKHSQGKQNLEDESDDEKKKRIEKAKTSFVRMRNSLGKVGFIIDKYKTTVEEFALMIKQQIEEVESYKNT